ncbi:MAG: hypothetical protein IJ740_13720 [Ruminococcus sp.]|nr:hypothetical protein [Ruminococcus sp.]
MSIKYGLCNAHYAKILSTGNFAVPTALPGAVSLTLDDRSEFKMLNATGISTLVGEELINNLGNVQGKASSLLDLVRNAKDSGQLSKIIGDVTDGLNKLIDIFIKAVEFIYKYRSEIATTVETMITLKAAFKIANDINKLVTTIASLIGAFTKLTASTESATVAQEELNSAMSLNPVVALITAVVTLSSVIATQLIKSTTAANEEFLKMGEAESTMKELADAAEDFSESMNNAAKNRADNIASIEGEYNGYKKLSDQLYDLIDKQDKTREDYKQINHIIGTLNGSIEGLGLSFDNTTGKLNMQRNDLTSLVNDYETYYKTIAMQDSLTQLYKDQYEAEQRLIEAKEEDKKALERFTAAEENYQKVLSLSKNGSNTNYDKELEAAKKLRDDASLTRRQTKSAVDDLSKSYSKLNKDISNINSTLSENIDKTETVGKRIKKSGDETAKTAEELVESYINATKAVSTYSSELTSLISIQKDISEGNKMSTLEMLDLIDKYPELVSHIKSAEDGYILEKEAIEELIKVRAQNMQLAAQEAAENQRNLLRERGLEGGVISFFERSMDSRAINDISKVQMGEYTDDLRI